MAIELITFVDRDGKPTDDLIQGLPVVQVWYDLVMEGEADFIPKPRPQLALVDTGANHSIIDLSLVVAGARVVSRNINSLNVGKVSVDDAYGAFLQVGNLKGQLLPVVAKRLMTDHGMKIPILLGRDMLSTLTMVYDCKERTFTLED